MAMCCSIEEAIQYIGGMADTMRKHGEKRTADMPERIVNLLKYNRARHEGLKPRYYKASRAMYSYWVCSNCGRGHLDVGDNYCPNCGYYIKWDSPRCLTGYDDPEDEPGKKEEEHETD